MPERFLIVFMLLMAATLSACSGGGLADKSGAGDGQFVDTASTQSQQVGIGGAAAAGAQQVFASQAGATPNDDDYKIAPLDVVEVTVYGVDNLNRTVQVSSSGMISLPLIKTVRAAGITSDQLERNIAAKLSATYLQSPQVSVFVKEYNSQKITVEGAVTKPGIYPTTGKISLMQAVALAGGVTQYADPSGVLIFRTTNNKRMAARFDLKQVRGGQIPDPQLQAGDIVMVDESAAKTTLRDVKEALPLTGLFQLLLL